MFENLRLIESTLDRLKIGADYSALHLNLLQSMDHSMLLLAMPSILSTMLRVLLNRERPLNLRQKRQIMSFIDWCLLNVCTKQFYSHPGTLEKINIMFSRLIQAQLLMDTSSIVEILARRHGLLEGYPAVVDMFILYHSLEVSSNVTADTEDIKGKLESIKSLNLRLDPLKEQYDTSDPLRYRKKWLSELMIGFSCLKETFLITPLQYHLITTPSFLLKFSPLVDDLAFAEYQLDRSYADEMLICIAVNSNSPVLLETLLLTICNARSSHLLTDEVRWKIFDAIYARGLVDTDLFIENRIFTDRLLNDREYTERVINKIIYLARFYQKVDYLDLLLEHYLNNAVLEGYLTILVGIIDEFLPDYPEECRLLITKLLKQYDTPSYVVTSRYQKCSPAVHDYILSLLGPGETEVADTATTKAIANLKRMYTYVKCPPRNHSKLLHAPSINYYCLP